MQDLKQKSVLKGMLTLGPSAGPTLIGEQCGRHRTVASSWAHPILQSLIKDDLAERHDDATYSLTSKGMIHAHRLFGRIVVTIDGPAGAGKTTLAKRVAQALGIPYLDTGAMFRGVAQRLGDLSWNRPPESLKHDIGGFRFALEGEGAASRIRMDGKLLGEEIRSETVSLWASNIAVIPIVRTALKRAQRRMGSDTSLVAEGRDMGTIVFPYAPSKLFLDAKPGIRAERRVKQLRDKGIDAVYEEVLSDIRKRDAQDRGRAVAPLRPAPDAKFINTSGMNIPDVFEAIMSHVSRTGVTEAA